MTVPVHNSVPQMLTPAHSSATTAKEMIDEVINLLSSPKKTRLATQEAEAFEVDALLALNSQMEMTRFKASLIDDLLLIEGDITRIGKLLVLPWTLGNILRVDGVRTTLQRPENGFTDSPDSPDAPVDPIDPSISVDVH